MGGTAASPAKHLRGQVPQEEHETRSRPSHPGFGRSKAQKSIARRSGHGSAPRAIDGTRHHDDATPASPASSRDVPSLRWRPTAETAQHASRRQAAAAEKRSIHCQQAAASGPREGRRACYLAGVPACGRRRQAGGPFALEPCSPPRASSCPTDPRAVREPWASICPTARDGRRAQGSAVRPDVPPSARDRALRPRSGARTRSEVRRAARAPPPATARAPSRRPQPAAAPRGIAATRTTGAPGGPGGRSEQTSGRSTRSGARRRVRTAVAEAARRPSARRAEPRPRPRPSVPRALGGRAAGPAPGQARPVAGARAAVAGRRARQRRRPVARPRARPGARAADHDDALSAAAASDIRPHRGPWSSRR